MENIFLLPTDKPSRLRIGNNGNFVYGIAQTSTKSFNDDCTNQHIYITSDEEIKQGEKCITFGSDKCKGQLDTFQSNVMYSRKPHKIILTTDQELIKDNIQAIDDEFLEWFVKNPSCELVEVIYEPKNFLDTKQGWEYEIIIPKEEPVNHPNSLSNSLTNKVNKQERSYSEEEVIAFGEFIFKHTLLAHSKGVKNLLEQFKKK
jgi:hypothetical protein